MNKRQLLRCGAILACAPLLAGVAAAQDFPPTLEPQPAASKPLAKIVS